jgi:DtxR family transcriptional regulator, Mn-dependent transcriptional regulator
MLEILGHRQIGIGTRLEVRKKFSFDQSIEIKIRNLPAFTISKQLSDQIWVKKPGT